MLLLGLSPIPAAAIQQTAPRQTTRCEDKAIEILEHAVRYSAPASNSSIPFNQADGFAKACGVLVRGLEELQGMACPYDLVGRIDNAQRQAKETLDKINSRYSYRFNCFVPDSG
jgi:hypothetical protein